MSIKVEQDMEVILKEENLRLKLQNDTYKGQVEKLQSSLRDLGKILKEDAQQLIDMATTWLDNVKK